MSNKIRNLKVTATLLLISCFTHDRLLAASKSDNKASNEKASIKVVSNSKARPSLKIPNRPHIQFPWAARARNVVNINPHQALNKDLHLEVAFVCVPKCEEKRTLSLSVDGWTLVGPNGKEFEIKSSGDVSRGRGFEAFMKSLSRENSIPLQGLTLKGGETLEAYLKKLAASRVPHAKLKVSVNGSGLNFTSARLRISKGGSKPPVNVAPRTRIISKIPAESVTASTSMAIEFDSDQAGTSFYCVLDGSGTLLLQKKIASDPKAVPCNSPRVYTQLSQGAHKLSVYAVSSAGIIDPVGATHTWTIVSPVDPKVILVSTQPAIGADNNLVTQSRNFSVVFKGSQENVNFKCAFDAADAVSCVSPFEQFAVSEGAHAVRVYAVDSTGNLNQKAGEFLELKWVVDVSGPGVNIVSAPVDLTSRRDARIEFVSNEAATFACAFQSPVILDADVKWLPCVSPLTLSNLLDGPQKVFVKAFDTLGNESPQAALSTWVVDGTKPVLTLGNVLPEQGLSNARSLSVEVHLNEKGSIQCMLDDQAVRFCNAGFNAVDVIAGKHKLVISANDVAGNAADPLILEWDIDYSAPGISIASVTPSSLKFVKTSDVVVTLNADVDVSRFSATLNGKAIDVKPEGVVEMFGLEDGAYELSVMAFDAHSNSSEVKHDFSVDTVLPQMSIAVVSNEVNPLPKDSIAFKISASEILDKMYCYLDGVALEVCQSEVTLNALTDDLHTFEVIGVDRAQNLSNANGERSYYRWSVDTRAPQTTVLGPVASGGVVNTSSIAVAFSSDEEVLSYECSVNGGPYNSCSSPWVVNEIVESEVTSNKILVRAKDVAGNVEVPQIAYEVFVDLTAPQAPVISGPAGSTEQMSAQFSLSSVGATSFVSCQLDSAPMSNCSGSVSIAGPLAPGPHSFSSVAQDAAGNQSDRTVYTWTVLAPEQARVLSYRVIAKTTSFAVEWTTSRPTSTAIRWGTGTVKSEARLTMTLSKDEMSMTHTLEVTGLARNSPYIYKIMGVDAYGNPVLMPVGDVQPIKSVQTGF